MFDRKKIATMLAILALACPAQAAEEVNLDAAAQQSVEISQDAVISNDTASADAVPAVVLPDIYTRAVELANEGRDKLLADVLSLYSQGKKRAAARAIGAAIGRTRQSSLAYLGMCCTKLYLAHGDVEEQTRFIAEFLYGYGKCGLLVITLDGITNARVYDRRSGETWKKAPAGGVITDAKTERIFSGPGFIAVPFLVGEIFKVDISGKEGKVARVCKIMPGGVNAKSWQGGKWDREITVRGDKLF